MAFYTYFKSVNEADAWCRGKGARYHHSASRKGYRSTCSHDEDPKPYSIEPYKGRYGEGFVLSHFNNAPGCVKSNNYYRIDYYII